MSLTNNPGRVAGFLYLLLVVLAPFRLLYIPSKLFVQGNATVSNRGKSAGQIRIVAALWISTVP